jgi:hypothetical protein
MILYTCGLTSVEMTGQKLNQQVNDKDPDRTLRSVSKSHLICSREKQIYIIRIADGTEAAPLASD